MRTGKGFFIKQTGCDWERGGYTVADKKAAVITRYSSTSYMDVMNMTFREIDKLIENLTELVELENKEREEALNGKRKDV